VLGKAAFALLREEHRAVEHDVELRAVSFGDLRIVLRARVDLGRETRGPPVVARSDGAVEDADVRHARSLSFGSAVPERREDSALVAPLTVRSSTMPIPRT
jgi:hypothetical protein